MPERPPLFRETKNKTLRLLSPVLASVRTANVAMFHIGRVGSTVVADMLGQHARVDWAGEFFHPDQVETWRSRLHETDPIRRLQVRMALAGLGVFGFETKYLEGKDLHQIGYTLEDYVDELLRLGFSHFVVLERKNLLRRFVSHAVGSARGGKWNVKDEPELTQVELDPNGFAVSGIEKTLTEWFDDVARRQSRLLEALGEERVLHITYEEHVRSDPRIAYRSICEFIGLEPTSTDVRFVKSNPFALDEVLRNYEEVATSLEGTSHEWMLGD